MDKKPKAKDKLKMFHINKNRKNHTESSMHSMSYIYIFVPLCIVKLGNVQIGLSRYYTGFFIRGVVILEILAF